MTKQIITLAITLALLFPGHGHAKFRALLIGIDYHNADKFIPPLAGAVNDVQDLHAFMTQTLHIPPSSIRVLTEKQAVRASILDHIQTWLIDGTQPGDAVFFQYSGHGVEVPDPFKIQGADPVKRRDSKQRRVMDMWGRRLPAHKLAEAFVPYDTQVDPARKQVSNLIVDTEFYALLRQLQGRKVLLWLDNCHAGGITRDALHTDVSARYLQLPWENVTETRLTGIPKHIPASPANAERGLNWQPAYAYFAATRYFQKAYEYPFAGRKNGAFSLAVMGLLKANPQTVYTNRQVLEYARRHLSNQMGFGSQDQLPMFYGPSGALDQPFLLLEQSKSHAVAEPAPSVEPQQSEAVTRVALRGRNAQFQAIETAIRQRSFLTLDKKHPDLIVNLSATRITLHNVVGRLLRTLPMRVQDVLNALETCHLVRLLARLHNPAAPFAVELWADQPDKNRFRLGDRITMYYRVKALPYGLDAYLTLVNVAPDGAIAVLYPQKRAFGGSQTAQLYLNAPVEPGKIHSIPKSRDALSQGQNVAVDLQIQLNQPGDEYFKAIVTSAPIDWESLNIGPFRSYFQGDDGHQFLKNSAKSIRRIHFWGTGSLRITVE